MSILHDRPRRDAIVRGCELYRVALLVRLPAILENVALDEEELRVLSSSRFLIVHNWPLPVGTADAVPAAPVSTSFVPVVDQYCVNPPLFRP